MKLRKAIKNCMENNRTWSDHYAFQKGGNQDKAEAKRHAVLQEVSRNRKAGYAEMLTMAKITGKDIYIHDVMRSSKGVVRVTRIKTTPLNINRKVLHRETKLIIKLAEELLAERNGLHLCYCWKLDGNGNRVEHYNHLEPQEITMEMEIRNEYHPNMDEAQRQLVEIGKTLSKKNKRRNKRKRVSGKKTPGTKAKVTK
jgi:hypothetical protein